LPVSKSQPIKKWASIKLGYEKKYSLVLRVCLPLHVGKVVEKCSVHNDVPTSLFLWNKIKTRHILYMYFFGIRFFTCRTYIIGIRPDYLAKVALRSVSLEVTLDGVTLSLLFFTCYHLCT
jgi:hypothetical protein